MNRPILLMVGMLVVSMLAAGCTKEETSLFDPNYDAGTPPEITNIEPADSAEAGSEIVIEGANFSDTPENNFVYFNATEGTVTEASSSELTVTAPDMVGDSIEIRIAVAQVEDFSNIVIYKLY